MHKFIEQSGELKREAEKMLDDSALLELLRQYGRVEITGSYSYDLMVAKDIDIHIFVKDLKKSDIFEIMGKLIEQNYFRSFKLDNFVDYPDVRFPDFPRGYYLGLQSVDRNWKIDLWFIVEDSASGKKFTSQLMKIDEATRILILTLKDYKKAKGWRFSSTVIYEAVLNGGVHNIGEFENYLKNKSIYNFAPDL
ncbi:MAG: hypothetical protein NTW50_02175 [Candidatus Berkelbacteria bacterium]|nr:hypothetical protein [Candidatus Berkelbacteria bacterium]